jgi:hypothetical protein
MSWRKLRERERKDAGMPSCRTAASPRRSGLRPDELLVVWRRHDGDVTEALKGVTYAKGDQVICAEWFDDGPLPAPTWYNGRSDWKSMSIGTTKSCNRWVA